MNEKLDKGNPWPLGATLRDGGVNFAIFSENADRVYLCIFDKDSHLETQRVEIPFCSDGIWHCFIPDLGTGTVYGYRIVGEYEPMQGKRFNAKKLLIDPYARDIVGEFHWSDEMFGFDRSHLHADLAISEQDNERSVPKALVCERASAQEIENIQSNKPQTPWEQTVIYEAHVRGLSQLNLKIPAELRGTFKGLCDSSVTDYLKDLGITAIELLPVHGFIDEEFLIGHGLSNYWGYNSLHFFMPHKAYLSQNKPEEFRQFVEHYHSVGLEVILDVVYNHTAESNQFGPTLSFRGIDNTSYYRLEADNARNYVNDTGCGNTLNIEHPRVLQLVMDSLRFWAGEMGVDGFRFDLASILGRNKSGFTSSHNFFAALLQDPLLSKCKLIAEPWDIGPGGYQLGAFPAPWSEWNDKYRDVVRRFWKGDPAQLPEFARRIHGSSDVFESSGRGPRSTINFITSHDGFTLADNVSYRERHNLANKEQNRDGHHSNFSENYGFEGPSHIEAITGIREQQLRNFILTLCVSQGTPMLLAGDEVAHSQNGNNNAYCQDNEITWIDWSAIGESESALLNFTKAAIAFRKSEPLLSWPYYIHKPDELTDRNPTSVRWFSESGEEMKSKEWNDPNKYSVLWAIEGVIEKSKHVLLIFFNASAEKCEFKLNQCFTSIQFTKVFDTANTSHQSKRLESISEVRIEARSILLLKSV